MENEIYSKYFNEIIRHEYKNYNPTSTLNFNSPNKKIDFNIDYGDSFSTSKYQYYITGEFTKKDGTAFPARSNVKLIDNFVPFLFSGIIAKKHNQVIDSIENPGITSTVKGIISYRQSVKTHLKIVGLFLNTKDRLINFALSEIYRN